MRDELGEDDLQQHSNHNGSNMSLIAPDYDPASYVATVLGNLCNFHFDLFSIIIIAHILTLTHLINEQMYNSFSLSIFRALWLSWKRPSTSRST